MLLLQALTCRRCSSDVNEVNIASSTAPPLDRAPQVARSVAKGHVQWGGLSFAFFSSAGDPVAVQRKEGAPPGAHPGQRPL